jgi:ABC-type sugar transport system substrate-binding protein
MNKACKLLTAVVIISAVILPVFGGGQQESGSKMIKIGICPPADSEFYQLIKQGIQEGIADSGVENVELLWQTPQSHQAVEDQQRIVEAWITAKLDAIAVTTVGDLYAMDAIFERGTNAGIDMYFLNMAEPQLEGVVDYSNFISSVGYNNYEAAKILGNWVVENLGNKGKAAVLLGTPGVHANHRLEGFMEALQGTDWEIVSTQEADWVRDKGQSVAETILQANRDLDLIYGQNDEMALGAYQAVVDRNLKDKVSVVGLDGVQAAVNSVIKGELTATMNVAPKLMGYQLATDILDHINGKSIPKIHDIDVYVTDSTRAAEDIKVFK